MQKAEIRWRDDMQELNSLKNRLIDVDDSVLVVIDVQDSFLEKYSQDERSLLETVLQHVRPDHINSEIAG